MSSHYNMPTYLSSLHRLANVSVSALARRLLLDWSERERFLSNPQQFLTETFGSTELELRSEIEELCRSLTSLSPEELAQILWNLANSSGTSSTWQTLYHVLGPYLGQIKQLMLEIIYSLPTERHYSDILCEVVENWPAALHKTPSSVIWPLAIAHTVDPNNIEQVFSLAAACAFYYQGVVIFDDIADGELEPVCAQWPRGQVEHLAYSMAGALPFLAINRLRVSAEIRCTVMKDFAEAIWITNIGQYMDLEMHAPIVQTCEDAERIAQCKTAKGIALLARAAAHFFQFSQDQVEAWTRCTHAFAAGRQIASDVRDIWNKRVSPDLFVGKCTLPIAYALTKLSGTELDEFQALRARCRYEHTPHARMRLWLEKLGALAYVQQRLSSYRGEGDKWLDKTNASETARAWIQTWASQADIVGEV